ncbi:MAG: 50S ribosomal protein L4 [Deltaproteobacteria bacterium]|nr:50S ribosomal protein L4 [Deltaproteobacteria bacterium]MBW2253175.1 50S ribosomal protein L4 [Deltaproteobacteria bacterium]
MPTIDVYNINREKVSEVTLDEQVFGADVKEHLLYAVVRYQLAKRRQGTHKVKGRSEVSGGGRKPWRQKGTGRARVGSSRSPLWRGGGVVFGPVPRDHGFKLNKKVRKAALRSALSRRAQEGALVVLDNLEVDEIKTKAVADLLDRFGLSDALFVLASRDERFTRSARNLPRVTVLPSEGLNVYDVLHRRNLVLTQGALEAVTQRLAR